MAYIRTIYATSYPDNFPITLTTSIHLVYKRKHDKLYCVQFNILIYFVTSQIFFSSSGPLNFNVCNSLIISLGFTSLQSHTIYNPAAKSGRRESDYP